MDRPSILEKLGNVSLGLAVYAVEQWEESFIPIIISKS